MADIELVIKIPEELYKNKKGFLTNMDAHRICDAVKNGTPLPEHHGDLKDVSKLVYDCSYDNGNGCDRICHCDDCNYHVVRESDIKTLPTIIPATEEKNSEKVIGTNVCSLTDKVCIGKDCRVCDINKQTATKEGDGE